MKVSTEWFTPEIDNRIAYMARVSNPTAKVDDSPTKLIEYLIRNKHWSPFEMANICLRVETTRDIARQLLRHRSLHFQEFSQRYAEVDTQDFEMTKHARLQDPKNRQNSLTHDDPMLDDSWVFWQNKVWDVCWAAYKACLALGIAKELARKLLPEGLTKSVLYVNGTVRDWYHYLDVRTANGTQLEHQQLAWAIARECDSIAPAVFGRIVGDGG